MPLEECIRAQSREGGLNINHVYCTNPVLAWAYVPKESTGLLSLVELSPKSPRFSEWTGKAL